MNIRYVRPKPLKLQPITARCFLLYPLKTSAYQRFSDVFMGYKKGREGSNGLKLRKILKIDEVLDY